MAVKKERIPRKENGEIIIEGWVPVEYFEDGFPIIQKSKIKSHTAVLIRENPAWLLTRAAVFVRVRIEKIKELERDTRKQQGGGRARKARRKAVQLPPQDLRNSQP